MPPIYVVVLISLFVVILGYFQLAFTNVVDYTFGDYINDGDRDKFGYAILCGPRNVMTYESVQEANEKFLDEFLGRK